MAVNNIALIIAVITTLVYCTNYGVYCINPQCQGTQCTLEDLGLDGSSTVSDKVLQNLTSIISRILESPLRIHITYDYDNSSCGTTTSEPVESLLTKSTPEYARDCSDIAAQGHNKSGVYKVRPEIHAVADIGMETELSQFEVYCDFDDEENAWTVFQRRQDGLVDFYRGWQDYKQGFGYFESEFWLGLDKLHMLTTQNRYQLKVTLEDADDNETYAKYDNFKIGDESTSYMLKFGDYEGTAGDSLRGHVFMRFSTKDRDNDIDSRHCAQKFKGGWWYFACYSVNLNGLYLKPGDNSLSGIRWNGLGRQSMKSSAMMIQRMT